MGTRFQRKLEIGAGKDLVEGSQNHGFISVEDNRIKIRQIRVTDRCPSPTLGMGSGWISVTNVKMDSCLHGAYPHEGGGIAGGEVWIPTFAGMTGGENWFLSEKIIIPVDDDGNVTNLGTRWIPASAGMTGGED